MHNIAASTRQSLLLAAGRLHVAQLGNGGFLVIGLNGLRLEYLDYAEFRLDHMNLGLIFRGSKVSVE